jgi:hypothetical protein
VCFLVSCSVLDCVWHRQQTEQPCQQAEQRNGREEGPERARSQRRRHNDGHRLDGLGCGLQPVQGRVALQERTEQGSVPVSNRLEVLRPPSVGCRFASLKQWQRSTPASAQGPHIPFSSGEWHHPSRAGCFQVGGGSWRTTAPEGSLGLGGLALHASTTVAGWPDEAHSNQMR